MAVVDFDPVQILRVMDNWPEVEGVDVNELVCTDGCEWYGYNADIADVLEFEPIISFDEVELGKEVRVELQELIIGRDYCHWQARSKYGDGRMSTTPLYRDYLLKFKDVIQRLKESIEK
jgi:hypothetical protein